MPSYYFTCGQSHSHKRKNFVWNKDSVLQVIAPDKEKARDVVFAEFGDKWCFCYESKDYDPSFFKNGICHTINVQ